jgi:hypothetical protein
MADISRISLKRSPYRNVAHKHENSTIITEPVQKVTAPMGATLAELPLPNSLQENLKKRKRKLNSILSDFIEMSESLDDSISELTHSDDFIKALRLFVNLFNANLMLLLEYEQQQKTNYSDYVLLLIRNQEVLLSHYGFTFTASASLNLDATKVKIHTPKQLLEDLFTQNKIFFEVIAYFDRIVDGHPPTVSPSQPKLHGLIIDRLG